MRKQPAAGRWLVLLALLAAARLTLAVLHPDEWAFEARRMYVVDNWDRQAAFHKRTLLTFRVG